MRTLDPTPEQQPTNEIMNVTFVVSRTRGQGLVEGRVDLYISLTSVDAGRGIDGWGKGKGTRAGAHRSFI